MSALTPKRKADAATIAAYLHRALAGHTAQFLALIELSGAMRLSSVIREFERLERSKGL